MALKNYDCKCLYTPLFAIPSLLLITGALAWLILTHLPAIPAVSAVPVMALPQQKPAPMVATRTNEQEKLGPRVLEKLGLQEPNHDLPATFTTSITTTADALICQPATPRKIVQPRKHTTTQTKNAIIAAIPAKERALHAVLKRGHHRQQQSTATPFSTAHDNIIATTDAAIPTLIGPKTTPDIRLYSIRKKIREHLLTSFRTAMRHASTIAREAFEFGHSAHFHVEINADGTLACLKLLQSSGCEELDHTLANVFESAVPFPQIPTTLGIKKYCITDVMIKD